MRTTHALLPLAVVLALPSLASANCYSIYDAKNQLAFQSSVSPIDLSTRISHEMRARFPGGYLIIIPDDADCRELRTGPVVSPRFEVTTVPGTEAPRNETIEASPLLRGAGTAPTSGASVTRGGNNLTIKR
jgi:hypothetical protein